MDLTDYNRRNVDERLGRLESELRVVQTDVAIIKATMATRDDLIQLQRWMFALILPIYGVLLVILIFLYNAKA
jgi:hypothetical protein